MPSFSTLVDAVKLEFKARDIRSRPKEGDMATFYAYQASLVTIPCSN